MTDASIKNYGTSREESNELMGAQDTGAVVEEKPSAFRAMKIIGLFFAIVFAVAFTSGHINATGSSQKSLEVNLEEKTDVTFPATLRFPTKVPVASPTYKPNANPTATPIADPTANPTPVPIADPTANPTPVPIADHTANPTPVPIADPTAYPTPVPIADPTALPTPTKKPVKSKKPTAAPTSCFVYKGVYGSLYGVGCVATPQTFNQCKAACKAVSDKCHTMAYSKTTQKCCLYGADKTADKGSSYEIFTNKCYTGTFVVPTKMPVGRV